VLCVRAFGITYMTLGISIRFAWLIISFHEICTLVLPCWCCCWSILTHYHEQWRWCFLHAHKFTANETSLIFLKCDQSSAVFSWHVIVWLGARNGRFLLSCPSTSLDAPVIKEMEDALNLGTVPPSEVFSNLRTKCFLQFLASIGRSLDLQVTWILSYS
jgi:hypothetical protein